MRRPLKCNACDFACCALDAFEACGCGDCHEPNCWDDDEFDDDVPDDYLED